MFETPNDKPDKARNKYSGNPCEMSHSSQKSQSSQYAQYLGKCTRCRENFKEIKETTKTRSTKATEVELNVITCQKCNNHYHVKCITKLELSSEAFFKADEAVAIIKVLSIAKGLYWMCDECSDKVQSEDDESFINASEDAPPPAALTEILNLIVDIQSTMNQLVNDVKSLKKDINEREQKENAREAAYAKQVDELKSEIEVMKAGRQVANTSSSYSDVLKEALKEPMKSIEIRPKDSEKNDRTGTSKRVVQAVDVVAQRVSRVEPAASQGVRISTSTANSGELMRKLQATLSNSFEIIEPGERRVKVKIVNFDNFNGLKEDEIATAVRAQNGELINDNEEFTVLKIIKHYKIVDRFTIIAEISQSAYKKIMKRQMLVISLSMCKVLDLLSVARCFKCSRYGHMAAACKSATLSCPKCSGNHALKDCDADARNCVNCRDANKKFNLHMDTNHAVWDRECTLLKRKIDHKQKILLSE